MFHRWIEAESAREGKNERLDSDLFRLEIPYFRPLCCSSSSTVLFFVSDNLIENSAVRSEAHGSQVEIRMPNPAR